MYSASKHATKNFKVVDLRSDTLTKPTPLMRTAMCEAEVGDDVFKEDPTVIALEEKAARIMDKEAGLFISSGTMGNLIAMMAHCDRRGTEVIVGKQSHVFRYEQGGAAQIAGILINPIPNKDDGTFCLDEVQRALRGSDIHEPITSLVIVENTHNTCGGKVIPLDWMEELGKICKEHNLRLHMDGARVFNAAVYLGIPVAKIVKDFDSVTFCLSKGLGAPVGSVLVGSKEFIKKAERLRKVLGGGMRQSGIIAAAGIVSLDHMVDRLSEDHARASTIAKAINSLNHKSFHVNVQDVHTNIVVMEIDEKAMSAEKFCDRALEVTENEIKEFGNQAVSLKCLPFSKTMARFVTYNGITDDDISSAMKKIQYIMNEVKA